ncbi:ribonuclease M5 [Megasphaera hominis]|jgi:ribonuclease M5|uniref:Ribonuclease M5 n=1 Tax=Megasphaera hominis TaxID=159836 RepID=A0ABR6VJJ5_9FIRM|nr:ribonuclease M5 [Megasphaera hominis]MBC3536889.1 ribonuclease M5 [Megasphaera hominis]
MIKEVLVVEGRSDVARIRASHIEADMITTDGFNLRPDTLKQIAIAYEKRGIIILTDPDSAGERIRKFLTERFPKARQAFIPRKDAIANNDLGVEQASPEAIRLALEKTRCAVFEPAETFTASDLQAAGLSGSADAADRRAAVGAILGIGYGNAKQFLRRLNHYGISREEWDQALEEVNHEGC